MNFVFALVLCLASLNHESQSSDIIGGNMIVASHKGLQKKINLKNFANLKGTFVQTKFMKELAVEIKTEGHFDVTRTDQGISLFHWNIAKPKVSQVCMDLTGIHLSSSGKNKKILFSEMGQDSAGQMKSLLSLISLDQNSLDEKFAIQDEGENHYTLTPKNAGDIFFKSARIRINPSGLVDSIHLIEKSHDELKIQFSALVTDKKQKLKTCEI